MSIMKFRHGHRRNNFPPVPSRRSETALMVLAGRVQQLIERLDEVEARLRAVSPTSAPGDGSGRMPGEVLMAGSLTVDRGARRVFIGGREVKLSPTEYRLLFELTRNAGNVVAHGDLMRVASWSSVGNRANLKVYMGRLRAKLNLASVEDGQCDVQAVRGAGYRLAA